MDIVDGDEIYDDDGDDDNSDDVDENDVAQMAVALRDHTTCTPTLTDLSTHTVQL